MSSVKNEALEAYRKEMRREAVEREKERLKAQRWWHKIFKYTVTIKRRET